MQSQLFSLIGWIDLANIGAVAATAATGGLALAVMLRKTRLGLAHDAACLAAVLVLAAPILGGLGARRFGMFRIPIIRREEPVAKSRTLLASDAAAAKPPSASREPIGEVSAVRMSDVRPDQSGPNLSLTSVEWVLAIWALGSLAMSSRVVWRLVRAGGMVRRSTDLRDPRTLDSIRKSSRQLAMKPPRIRSSDESKAPAALGPLRPVIILPRGFAERLSDDELSFVLRHELAHLRELHHGAALVQCLAASLFWWLPPVRWLGRVQAAIQEEIADDIAVADFPNRRFCAELLIRLAELATREGRSAIGLGIHASPWGFDRRILQLLQTGDRPMTRVASFARWTLGLGALAAGLVLMVVTVRAEPRNLQAPQMEQEGRQVSDKLRKNPAEARQRGSFSVESFKNGQGEAVKPAEIVREDGMPPKIVYPSSRKSSRFVETKGGANVAVSEGIEWQGKTAYLSLTFDVVVTKVGSEKALWSTDVGAFWNTLTFENTAKSGDPDRWAVVLGSSRQPEYRKYLDLDTGRELETKGAPPQPTGDRLTPRRVWSGSAGIEKTSAYEIVSTADGWKAIREKLFGAKEFPGADKVDFDSEVVLVAYGGEQSNWNGISVEEAFENDERILVRLHRSTYQSFGQTPVEHPYGLIVLPRRTTKLYVLERNTQGLIGGPALWKEQTRLSLPKN
jgi:BlaR1 peptidase M56